MLQKRAIGYIGEGRERLRVGHGTQTWPLQGLIATPTDCDTACLRSQHLWHNLCSFSPSSRSRRDILPGARDPPDRPPIGPFPAPIWAVGGREGEAACGSFGPPPPLSPPCCCFGAFFVSARARCAIRRLRDRQLRLLQRGACGAPSRHVQEVELCACLTQNGRKWGTACAA